MLYSWAWFVAAYTRPLPSSARSSIHWALMFTSDS